jgi:hypothetical protein
MLCVMLNPKIAENSAPEFFYFYFALFEFNLAIEFLGIFIVVINHQLLMYLLTLCCDLTLTPTLFQDSQNLIFDKMVESNDLGIVLGAKDFS